MPTVQKGKTMKNDITPKQARSRVRQKGVTLLEMMVVLVILGIVITYAYPSYGQFTVRTKRNAGTSMLLQIADRQEQYFMNNKQYSGTLAGLGFAADPFMITDDGTFCAAGDADRLYSFALSNATATTYTVTATPQLRQAEKDMACANLTLTHTGLKGNSAGDTKCW